MNRRKAVQKVALLLGGAVVGAEMLIQTGCKPAAKEKATAEVVEKILPDFFTKEEITFLDEVAETILPRTSTPGAKDAKVGEFMNIMVRDCYVTADQEVFKNGIREIDRLSNEKYKTGFMSLQPQQRTRLLEVLDREAKAYKDSDDYKTEKKHVDLQEQVADSTERLKGNFGYIKAHMPPHYFSMMSQLTLLGFFTSEAGATKALRYAAVPGKYDPCMSYAKGDRAWATS